MTLMKRPIFYDTETTGVRSAVDRVIEIAAYDPVQEKTYVSLINPGSPIPREATDIHGISDAMVASAPSFKEVAAAFTDFCSGETVLIAHNNDTFDKLFLQNEFQRAGLTMPAWPFIDSLKWARKYRPDLPRHTLQSLREVYGIAANQAHRALDDVIVLHKVFMNMVDDLSMETIIDLLAQAGSGNRMPWGKYQGRLLNEVPKDYVQWLRNSGAFDKPENKDLKESFEKLLV
jgi:DNA polymerase-3 subunit epsilon